MTYGLILKRIVKSKKSIEYVIVPDTDIVDVIIIPNARSIADTTEKYIEVDGLTTNRRYTHVIPYIRYDESEITTMFIPTRQRKYTVRSVDDIIGRVKGLKIEYVIDEKRKVASVEAGQTDAKLHSIISSVSTLSSEVMQYRIHSHQVVFKVNDKLYIDPLPYAWSLVVRKRLELYTLRKLGIVFVYIGELTRDELRVIDTEYLESANRYYATSMFSGLGEDFYA